MFSFISMVSTGTCKSNSECCLRTLHGSSTLLMAGTAHPLHSKLTFHLFLRSVEPGLGGALRELAKILLTSLGMLDNLCCGKCLNPDAL